MSEDCSKFSSGGACPCISALIASSYFAYSFLLYGFAGVAESVSFITQRGGAFVSVNLGFPYYRVHFLDEVELCLAGSGCACSWGMWGVVFVDGLWVRDCGVCCSERVLRSLFVCLPSQLSVFRSFVLSVFESFGLSIPV